MGTCRGSGVFVVLAMVMAMAANAIVPITLPIVPGESVVTCFSGLQTPLVSPPYAAEPNGPVVGIYDTRLPVIPTNPVPVFDVNWQPPNFENLSGPPSDTWTAKNLGQVFGLCLDNAPNPNIYVSATTVYGASFAFGPGGPGAIYRIDGTTGSICILAQLPNGGPTGAPALGQLAFDPNSNNLYCSNFEDGLVYIISLNSSNGAGNPCGTQQWTTYNHGIQGRTDASMTTIADDGIAGNFTALGRRVWAVVVEGNRLYYSVWWKDQARASSPEGNQVWSVQIDGAGQPIPGTAILEFTVSDLTPGGGYSQPVSDIEFTQSGAMLVAERTMPSDTNYVDQGYNAAHQSRVLKYTGSSGSFVQLPDNTYRTGKIFTSTNSAGGVSSDCEENVWAMVDAIHFGGTTGDPDTVYGLQNTAAAGNATDATATALANIIGFGGGFFKAQLGEEDYVRECGIVGEGEGEGEKDCLAVSNDHADCISDANGQSVTYTFDVTNNSGVDAYWALFTPQTPGITISPNLSATFIPNGGTQNFTINITGATPGQPICFTITLLDKSRKECCSKTICFENPCNCVVIPVDQQKIECDLDNPGCWNYTFYITNTSPFTLSHMYLYPDSGGTFTPNYVSLGGLAPGATAGPFTVSLCGAQPGTEYCFTITLHDKELRECCAFRHCIELPNCCKPDVTPPVITVSGPTTVHCGEPGEHKATAIDDCDGDVSQTLQIKGQVNWYVNGTYCVTITASDSSGNVATLIYCITVTGCPDPAGGAVGKATSTADQNQDATVQLSELLRVVQFYNAGGLHYDPTTEDGYAPGLPTEVQIAPYHSCDYIQPDWTIELSELLRLVQLFNAGGYHVCVDSEDGFCAGK